MRKKAPYMLAFASRWPERRLLLNLRLGCAILIFTLTAVCQVAHAVPFSNPVPTVSSNPTETILHMELNGFPDYGVPDHAADIAYTGESNTWTFTLPEPLNAADFSSAFFRASLVADDHYGYDPSLYAFNIHTNGNLVYSGPAGLAHGTPLQSVFENWSEQDFPIQLPLQTEMTFSLTNTSGVLEGEWIAIDWIELHLTPVPEPGAAILGLIAGGWVVLAIGRGRFTRRSSGAGHDIWVNRGRD